MITSSAAPASAMSLPAEVLIRFTADALAASGLPHGQAAEVAKAMLEADLTGADAHGIFRLPQYIAALQRGDINPKAQVRVTKTGPATAQVDGDNGMGHLVMSLACEAAIDIARQSGVAWVGVNHSNHAGAGGVYAAIPASRGMVGIYSAVSGVNHMAASGGAEPLLGTNPLAIAIPARDGAPVIIDIAMSVVSSGTVRAHAVREEPMPEGWMVERATGLPILDAANAVRGLMVPVGDYKGAGLALALGLLAGSLNGAAFGSDIADFAKPAGGFGVNTGQFILVLDVTRFMPLPDFMREVQRHLDRFEGGEKLPGATRVRLPGAERALRRSERLAKGVPVNADLLVQLKTLAIALNIQPLPREKNDQIH